MTKILWKASTSQIENSNLYRYEKFLKINYKTKKIKNYKSLLNWSIKQPKYFRSSIWDFAKVYGEKKDNILKREQVIPKDEVVEEEETEEIEKIAKGGIKV